MPFLRAPRDVGLREVEAQIRGAIRDAVNRPSRKPFRWGGLAGYRQLEAIAQVLKPLPDDAETDYLHQLARQVEQVLENNRSRAEDLGGALGRLKQIAECLRYPPSKAAPPEDPTPPNPVTSDQVRREMDALLNSFGPDPKRRPVQTELHRSLLGLWKRWGPDLLPSYDLPGLPPDNLKLEALFGRLRTHQRRISGRKSTAPLRDFGAFQSLFESDTPEELLEQLRRVPPETYREQRRRLAQAEEPRQRKERLHRNPEDTLQRLVDQHTARRAKLDPQRPPPPLPTN